ncbi:hypothetical protein PORY_000282 [Pneumocystis oryctolagi]|uniref:Uncharacterized protein n=1 Tax=Pneumocystis oryctolagi TaxID=42067 RepID=A0ACB7CEV3_9ASCO|nr:hypothetical protein PORY_000282 [Pneumocystis oryctolagi]
MSEKESESQFVCTSMFFSIQKKIRHLKSLSIRNITFRQPLKPSVPFDTQIHNTYSDNAISFKPESHLEYNLEKQINNSIPETKVPEPELESLCQPKLEQHNVRGNTVAYEESLSRLMRLDNALKAHLVDTFFTLHVNNIERPLYISEIVTKTMNPDFLSFDLSTLKASFNRLSSFTICIWISNGGPFRLLLKQLTHLESLNYIGENLYSFKSAFPENCIILRFNNGYYSSNNIKYSYLCPSIINFKTKECYSYNDIIKLNTLEKCIWDANSSKKTLMKSLEKHLDKYYKILKIQKQKNKSSKHLSELENIIIFENKKLKEAKEYKCSLQKNLNSRRKYMKISQKNQKIISTYLEDAKKTLQYRKETLYQILNKISLHRSHIVSELQNIFPIEPIVDKPLNFTICNLLLPNTNYYKHDDDCIAASLGYTAHLIYLLAFYLRIPLRYPIRPMCSRTIIEDPISNTLHTSKRFPLWSKGQDHSQFDFGVFLLNKNIEQLMDSQSLIVTNLRHTLPNCKCLLLYIISHLS